MKNNINNTPDQLLKSAYRILAKASATTDQSDLKREIVIWTTLYEELMNNK